MVHEQHFDELIYKIRLLLQQYQLPSVIVHSGDALAIYQDDQYYPTKPNPWWHWFFGRNFQQASYFIITDQRLHLCLLQPNDYWHATPQPWSESAKFSELEIQSFSSKSSLERYVQQRVSEKAQVLADPRVCPFATADDNAFVAELRWLRSTKTDWEVSQLREANRVGMLGQQAAELAYRANASEWEIHLAYLAAVRQSEAELPYDNIIALNEHASILHYTHRERSTHLGESLLVDAGATVSGYASDITRTYVRADAEFQALISAVTDMQQRLITQMQPGRNWLEFHQQCMQWLAQILVDHSLCSASADEVYAQGLCELFMPHGLGHLLGLQVHDVAGKQADPCGGIIEQPKQYPYLRLLRDLKEGMVVTVEPGLYFIDSLRAQLSPAAASLINEHKWQRLKKMGGIRIEDNVVITSGLPINLTRGYHETPND